MHPFSLCVVVNDDVGVDAWFILDRLQLDVVVAEGMLMVISSIPHSGTTESFLIPASAPLLG